LYSFEVQVFMGYVDKKVVGVFAFSCAML
jgi:hypothetical protein